MLKTMLDKLNNIVESASQIFTTLRSQMPYPYVHLVSFVVHVYLFVTTTWFGSFLHTGFPTAERFQTRFGGQDIELLKSNLDVSSNYWTAAWCYVFVLLANVMFQGLLDMHSLLDNPFGSHSAKFPLRAHITKLMNSTRTMLKRADQMPAAFKDVFSPREQIDGSIIDDSATEGMSSGAYSPGGPALSRTLSTGQPNFADFLNPPSAKFDDYVLRRDARRKGGSWQATEAELATVGEDGAMVDIKLHD